MEDTVSSTTESSIVSSSNDDDRRCCKKTKSESDTDVEEEPEDKISRLPDDILGNILSSFSTKESVRTSILSKRWRYVWTSVPNLVLNDSEFLHDKERNTLDTKNCFGNFMNRVLHLHNVSCMQKFHLVCGNDYGLSSFSEWINTAICQDVEEIDLEVVLIENVELPRSFFTSKKLVVLMLDPNFFLNVPISVNFPNLKIVHLNRVKFADDDSVEEIDLEVVLIENVELPRSFFTSKKLVVLMLDPNFFLNVPISVNFPNLKIVHLNRVKFADDDSVKNFVAGCPVLEELDIIKCAHENVQTLCIQSSTLKRLRVRLLDDHKRDFEYRLVIESPNLEYLDLTNCVTEDCSVTFLSSLVEVCLSVTLHRLLSKDYNKRFSKLLQNISNTKYLELCWVEMDFSRFPHFGNVPVFINLTCLKVIVSEETWDVLPFMLKLSPNLRTCFIGKLVYEFHWAECQWESPDCIPKCLLLCLEEIVITEFEACDNEIEMVEYFLKNGRVLKKMSIEFIKLNSKEKSYVRKKLLAFPKSSSTCKISFSSRSYFGL